MTLVVGGLAIVSDLLDGYIARRLNQQSDLGKILDPIADKLVIGVVILALILSNPKFPLWAFAIVIIRDCLIVTGNIIVFSPQENHYEIQSLGASVRVSFFQRL